MRMKTVLTAALTYGACVAARQEVEGLPPREGRWVRLRPTGNPGAAFGLPLDPAYLPGLTAGSMMLILTRRRVHPAAAGLILGGGLSNLWERLYRGEVLDYLQFPQAPGKLGKYVYNLADLAILAGGAGLLLAGDRRPQRGG